MPITSAKLASPSERERALGIGSFGARYRECQRGAPEPVRDRFRAEVTGAGAPAGSLERVDEGGINRVRRVLLRRDEHVPVRVLLSPRQPRLPRHRHLDPPGREGGARITGGQVDLLYVLE